MLAHIVNKLAVRNLQLGEKSGDDEGITRISGAGGDVLGGGRHRDFSRVTMLWYGCID